MELQALQKQISILTMDEVEKYAKQRFFELANKPGKLLARKLRNEKVNKIIYQVQKDKKIYTDQKSIKEIFYNYFSNLTKETGIDEKCIMEYLDHSKIQKITEEQKDQLEKSISVEEISKAIARLKMGKCPGPDGLCSEFYKTFKEQIISNQVSYTYQPRLLVKGACLRNTKTPY